MAARLESPAGGYYNAAESEDLLYRGKELFDGALPAANAVAALDLLDLAEATGEQRFAAAAERTLRAFASLAARHADGARTMALAFARLEARRRWETDRGAADRKRHRKRRRARRGPPARPRPCGSSRRRRRRW